MILSKIVETALLVAAHFLSSSANYAFCIRAGPVLSRPFFWWFRISAACLGSTFMERSGTERLA